MFDDVLSDDVLSDGVPDELVLPDSPVVLARLVDAAVDKLARAPLGLLGDGEVLGVVETLERAWRRADGVNARLLVEVSDREAFRVSGHTTVKRFYAQQLRLGAAEASARVQVAEAIAPMRAMTGQMLPPKREVLAAAVADGNMSAGHVREVEKILARIPHTAGADEVTTAIAILGQAACEFGPQELRPLGDRVLAHLDPDGRLGDDTDRHRRRGITVGRQDDQLMSTICGSLTPALRATVELILHNWAAPGINSPDDEHSPAGAVGELTDAQREVLAGAIDRDTRTPAQRNHDALAAACEWILGHSGLGRPDRIPTQLVINVDEADLARRAGVGLSTTGTRIPIVDLVSLAADAAPWLEVFAHTTRDYAAGGQTNLGELGSVCGPDNRNVGTKPGQWETTIIDTGPDTGRTGWRLIGTTNPYRTNPIHNPIHNPILLHQHTTNSETTSAATDSDPPASSPVEAALERLLDAAV